MPAVIRLHAISASFLIHQLGRISAALADETGVEPLFCDAFELAEQIEPWFSPRIAPFRVEQALGDVEEQRGRPHVA